MVNEVGQYKEVIGFDFLQFGSCDGVVMFFCSSGSGAESIVGSFGLELF